MARTSKESKRAARAAAMQLLYEAFAGGDGGENSVQLAYEVLRDTGVVTSAMDAELGASVPGNSAPDADPDAPLPIIKALPNKVDRTFIQQIVSGVIAEASELDERIEKASIGWPIHRLSRVDLTILRMGTWELLHRPSLPPAVVVNEAVLLANQFSEPTSGRFINGVLGTIGRSLDKPHA